VSHIFADPQIIGSKKCRVIAARLTPLPASIARASELLKPELVRRTMLMQDKDAELPVKDAELPVSCSSVLLMHTP
jgi:hypothetical protein